MQQEGRQCLLCFPFFFTSEFLEQLCTSNSHFGGKHEAHENRQWAGMLAGHLPPKSKMLWSQKSAVYSLIKYLLEIELFGFGFLFSFGVLVFFCLVWNHNSSSSFVARMIQFQHPKDMRPPTQTILGLVPKSGGLKYQVVLIHFAFAHVC